MILFQDWHIRGQPASFWISGFFRPQSILTAVMQVYSRRKKILLIEVGLDHEILEIMRATEPPEIGIYVYGLYIEGAHWNREE